MLTVRENFLRSIKGQDPEYLTTFSLFWAMNGPPFFRPEPSADGTIRNMFGVESVKDPGGVVDAYMPKTHDFILTDIAKWGDVIKLPNPDDITDSAWADAAKQARDRHNFEIPFAGSTGIGGVFQTLVGVMGFTEGLTACYEEPELVKEMFAYITDYTVKMAKKFAYYYNPDYTALADDIAHERNPFVSLEMFKDIFAPCWKAYYDVFTEVGIPCGHHNCGYFEPLLEDLVSMGVTFWDPVQSSNDTFGIKEKYGKNLVMCQSYDVRFINDDTTEEEIRATFRDYVSKIAPGGGWAFVRSGVETLVANREIERQFVTWIYDEYDQIKNLYY
ncbi:MAG: hypothetical protein FWH40_06525 [Coriobacteriia bacterium]|nr:hypothetical protein [Coriobacteriia bacterium]